MRLIDDFALTTAIEKRIEEATNEDFAEGLSEALLEVHFAPTVDAVQVVRCKDCKYSYAEELNISSRQGYLGNRLIRFCKYELPTLVVADMHFCSCGARKDNGNND